MCSISDDKQSYKMCEKRDIRKSALGIRQTFSSYLGFFFGSHYFVVDFTKFFIGGDAFV